MTHDPLLAQQIEYYRARAGEYDEWFLRQGRYDRGPEANARWFEAVADARRALHDFGPTSRVLELAGGTGLWTEELARHADSVTVVDSSPEMLAINRDRVGVERVRHVQADIFTWEPDGPYDVVFFAFWLSHVPPERFDGFWSRVRGALSENGRVFFVDSVFNDLSTAVDHRLEGPEGTSVERRLNDGRSYRIVKVFYRPDDLSERLRSLGWESTVHSAHDLILYGWGQPTR